MEGRDAEADLRLARVALAGPDALAGRQRRRRGVRRDRAVAGAERRGGEARRLLVGQVADDRHDGVGRPVGAPPEVVDGRLRQGQDVRLLAADLATQRPVPEHRRLEQDLAVLGRVVEVRADLLDDDRPLALDVRALEPRPDDQLADDVHRPGRLAPRDAHPVDRRFAVGRGVERAADPLDRLADRPRRRDRRSCP